MTQQAAHDDHDQAERGTRHDHATEQDAEGRPADIHDSQQWNSKPATGAVASRPAPMTALTHTNERSLKMAPRRTLPSSTHSAMSAICAHSVTAPHRMPLPPNVKAEDQTYRDAILKVARGFGVSH